MGTDELTRVLARSLPEVSLAACHTVPLSLQHAPDDHALELVLHDAGVGVVSVDATHAHAFAPGSIELYPARMPHQQRMTHPGIDRFLRWTPSAPRDALLQDWIYLPPLDPELAQEVRRIAVADGPSPADRAGRLERDLRASALLLRLLRHPRAEHLSASPGPDAWARDAHRLIQAEAVRLPSVVMLAARLGVPLETLRASYQRGYGCTLVRALMEARLAAVDAQLQTSDAPLAAIAARCGFASAGYLCRVYRRLRGTSPSLMRPAKGPSRP